MTGVTGDMGVTGITGPSGVTGVSGVSALSGDVAGAAGSNQIAFLQGFEVSAFSPKTNQVLTFDGIRWVAADPAAGPTTPPTGIAWDGGATTWDGGTVTWTA